MADTCAECDKPVRYKKAGLCATHYTRTRKGIDADAPIYKGPRSGDLMCHVLWCRKDGKRRKRLSAMPVCQNHYCYWVRNGRFTPPQKTCERDGCSIRFVGAHGSRKFCSVACNRRAHTDAITRTCSIKGCDRKFYGKGWCHLHYSRDRADLPMTPELLVHRPYTSADECSVAGCDKKPDSRGLCKTHYLNEVAPHRHGHRARARAGGGRVFKLTARDFRRLMARQGGCCFFCDKAGSLELDHVVPLSRGGDHGIGNVVYSCRDCNGSRNWLLVSEWRHAAFRVRSTRLRAVLAA